MNNITDPQERVHHPYSPSSLQNLEACPCYFGRDTQHARAIAGTIAHNITETGRDDARLSDDDAVLAAECMDFYESRRQEMLKAWEDGLNKTFAGRTVNSQEVSAFPQIVELKETYLEVDSCVFQDAKATTAGYVDRAIINHTRTYAELFDWKFGLWPVEQAANNLQGIAYTLGLFRAYPALRSIRFWFKQPALELTSDAVFTREQIPALYLRVQTVVARAREARATGDFALANPTVPVCNFCANLGKCPKVLSIAVNVAKKFSPLDIPEHVTPTMVLDCKQTTLAMRLSQVMKVWAEAFRAQVTDRVLRRACDMPDGFTLQSQSKREVIDKSKYRHVSLRYLSQEEYDACADAPTFGSVEEAIQEKAPRGQKKSTLEQFKRDLEEAGAVKRGDPYSFLRAVAKEETTNKQ